MPFLRNLLATIVGLFIFSGIVFAGFFVVFAATASSGDEVPVVKENSVLYLPLTGMVVEQKIEDPFADLIGDAPKQVGLRETIKAIEAAGDDDRIKGIYIETKYLQASSASLQEIRDALILFKESGKFIYGYGEYMSESDYYLTSTADSVFLNPESSFEFNGLSANLMFYKGFFDKLDIEPVIFRVGTFKSFVEPYTRTEMSEENRKQYSELLNSVYNQYLTEVATSRNMEVDALREISDGMKITFAEDAQELGLVDVVDYEDVVKDVMRGRLGLKEGKDIKFMKVADYAKVVKANLGTSSERIAVIVADGTIVPSGGDGSVGGEQFARYIRKARKDKKVKAIVLRINSPGGSLLGSDMIWREVMLTKGVKPIIASMGGVAASGGYYMAMAADTIVAQPNTITGSIGIFSMLFNFEKFFDNKLGLTHDAVGTGDYSDFITVTREMTPYEKDMMQRGVEEGYRTFTTKVAEGRGMAVEDVLEVAEGRVWSGAQAKERGLVDVLGSYDDAIELAAVAADMEEYSLRVYPVQKPFFEKLMQDLGGQTRNIFGKDHILAQYEKQLQALKELEGIQARMPGDLVIK